MCLHFLFTLTQWYKKGPQWAPNSSISGGYFERLEGNFFNQQRMMSYSTQSHKPSKFVFFNSWACPTMTGMISSDQWLATGMFYEDLLC